MLQRSCFKPASDCSQPLSQASSCCEDTIAWRHCGNADQGPPDPLRAPKHSCPPQQGSRMDECYHTLAHDSSRLTELSVPPGRVCPLELAGCRGCGGPSKSAAPARGCGSCSCPSLGASPAGWKSALVLEEEGAGIWRRPLGSSSLAVRNVPWQRHKAFYLTKNPRQPELLQLNMDREVNAACCSTRECDPSRPR